MSSHPLISTFIYSSFHSLTHSTFHPFTIFPFIYPLIHSHPMILLSIFPPTQLFIYPPSHPFILLSIIQSYILPFNPYFLPSLPALILLNIHFPSIHVVLIRKFHTERCAFTYPHNPTNGGDPSHNRLSLSMQ